MQMGWEECTYLFPPHLRDLLSFKILLKRPKLCNMVPLIFGSMPESTLK